MRILLSGASGFIGSEVFFYLKSQGAEVVRLQRDKPQDLEGFDGVIHLAGEPIFGLWTRKKKKRIYESRVQGTLQLVHLLSQTKKPPRVFICASAVGYYGNRGDEWLTEKSAPGTGFLAHVCADWEAAARELKGVRVVSTRFGIVLDREGGMLKKMTRLFRYGLGSLFGTGQQWISWIARSDLVRALAFCLETESIEGPVNLVSPNPIRQKEFAAQLAKTLHRPLFFRLPAWLLRALLGEMAGDMLLASQRALPAKLEQHNFTFQHTHFT